MAGTRDRKTQRTHDASHHEHPPKRRKPTKSDFPPALSDPSSNLREDDRQTSARRHLTRPGALSAAAIDRELARFARHGGPDLSDLRGFSHRMASIRSRSHYTRITTSTGTQTSVGRKSTGYDENFESLLEENNIYFEEYSLNIARSTPRPKNFDRLREDLQAPRECLTLLNFSESDFHKFMYMMKTRSEATMMRTGIPMIAGISDIQNEGNLKFTNLESLTGGKAANAWPDFYDGADPMSIERDVRSELNKLIIPTRHKYAPVLPNFFLEAKTRQGNLDVALRQACYDGAHGARAMHSLQNYKMAEPIYDGNAYTFSSTFQGKILEIFAHHMMSPGIGEKKPRIYMTKVRGFDMTDSREMFIAGATAFRNSRDLARRYRDSFIEIANAKVLSINPATPISGDDDDGLPPSNEPTNGQNGQMRVAERDADGLPPPDEHTDGAVHVAEKDFDGSTPFDEDTDGSDCTASQDANETPRQREANSRDENPREVRDEVLAAPHRSDTPGGSQDHERQSAVPMVDGPSQSLVSSFTSAWSEDSSLSGRRKHPRSPSPKPKELRRSKRQTRASRRVAQAL